MSKHAYKTNSKKKSKKSRGKKSPKGMMRSKAEMRKMEKEMMGKTDMSY